MNKRILVGTFFSTALLFSGISAERLTEEERQYNRTENSAMTCDDNIEGEADATKKNVRSGIKRFRKNVSLELPSGLYDAMMARQVMLEDGGLPNSEDLASKEEVENELVALVNQFIADLRAQVDSLEGALLQEAGEGASNVSDEVDSFRRKKQAYEDRFKPEPSSGDDVADDDEGGAVSPVIVGQDEE
ncbi:hypothetical protein ACFLX2_00960 [Candidatus Dependentiae bacterium]